MSCSVKKCKNIRRLLCPNSGITFHGFPTDPVLFSEWLKAIGRDNENKAWSRNMVICSQHFHDDDLIRIGTLTRLRKSAIPLQESSKMTSNICLSPQRISPTNSDSSGCTQRKRVKLDHFHLVESPRSSSLKRSSIITCDNEIINTKSSTSNFTYYESSNSQSSNLKDEEFQKLSIKRTLWIIEKKPQFYIGVPEDAYFLIKLLCDELKTPLNDLLLCFKKIKLNTTFKELGDDFGISTSHAIKLFSKNIPLIAQNLKRFIMWPDKNIIFKNLPISFRTRYNKIQSIIDCLEIQTEKPTNPILLLDDAPYKNSNVLKYLVSYTPDGFINYISKGYSGQMTDVHLIEKCGYLQCLPQKCHIMGDSRFEAIEELFINKYCTFIKLSNNKLTKQKDLDTKRITHLNLYVEKLLGKIRKFKLLDINSCIDYNLIPLMDDIILIACTLLNLQVSL